MKKINGQVIKEWFPEGLRGLKSRLMEKKDPARLRAATYTAATVVLSLFLSMVRMPMGAYPLGFAAYAAARGGIKMGCALFGAAVGGLAVSPHKGAYLGALALMTAVRLGICFFSGGFRHGAVNQRRLFREPLYIRIILGAGGAATVGCVSILRTESVYYGLFGALLGIGGAALATAAFAFLSDKSADSSKRAAGIAVLAMGACASLELFGLPFSLGAVFAFLAPLYFSYTKNASLGCVVGFACGLSLGGPYGGVFGSCALVSGLMWEHSRSGAVGLSALCAAVLSLLCAGPDGLFEVVPEITLAGAVAAPLFGSGRIATVLPSFLRAEAVCGADEFCPETRTNERLAKIGEALESLSKLVWEFNDRMCLPTKSEACRICAAARARHCSGCAHEGLCTGREDAVVTSFFNNMAYRLSKKGKVSARIVPPAIAGRCHNVDAILESVNAGTKRLSARSESTDKTSMLAKDYAAVADMIKEVEKSNDTKRDAEGERRLLGALDREGFSLSRLFVYGRRSRNIYLSGIDLSCSGLGEEDIVRCCERELGGRMSSPEFSIDERDISAKMHSIPAFQIFCGTYSLSSSRAEKSGDCVTSFENGEGYHYTLVSDGMGSGNEAAVTSGVSAAFLKKLLSGGCPMRGALELLNSFVRGADGESFATIDLMEADLYTGRARFIKSGAAPSFIIRGGKLFRIHSKTVPVGIMRALDAEAVSFDLRAGDTVIMISDGVTGSYEDCPWLYELLCDKDTERISPRGAARLIAEEAEKNTGRDDDITVCVLKVQAA